LEPRRLETCRPASVEYDLDFRQRSGVADCHRAPTLGRPDPDGRANRSIARLWNRLAPARLAWWVDRRTGHKKNETPVGPAPRSVTKRKRRN
jgi:hypothetical protein